MIITNYDNYSNDKDHSDDDDYSWNNNYSEYDDQPDDIGF